MYTNGDTSSVMLCYATDIVMTWCS